MRERIYRTIEVADADDTISKVYDVFMMVCIVISIIPLAFKAQIPFFTYSEYVVTGIFLLDYLLRWITADFKLKKNKGRVLPFLLYPLTPMAIIDLLAILPTFLVGMNEAFKILKVARLLRTFRVLRIFKVIRYSKSIKIIVSVFKKHARSLITVAVFAIGYILVAALVIFNVEQQSFNNFFEAVYWATVSLTTVGYGDIYPVTTIGRVITMLSSILGIAIIALPSGIITAGFLEELRERESQLNTNSIQVDKAEDALSESTETNDTAPQENDSNIQ